MEDMRREGTEPVGTCPVCKAENPDPFTKLPFDSDCWFPYCRALGQIKERKECKHAPRQTT
jgi:hypothetical protein